MLTFDGPWLEKGEKLVCFGDSLTESPDGYVPYLKNKLQHWQIEVVNAGRSGDKTPTALTRLQSDVIALRPDAVSIFLGTNDAGIGRGIWADEPRVEPETYKNILVWIVHLCRLAGIRKFSIATPAWQYEGPARDSAGSIMPFYCIAAREAADESGSWLVPLDTVFAREWQMYCMHAQSGLLRTRDGIHMTERGNELIVQAMLSAWHFNADISPINSP